MDQVHIRTHSKMSATDGAQTSQTDRGLTFVEVVLTVVVMGIVIVPAFQALLSSVRMSQMSMEAAEVQTVLQNAADRVNRAPISICYQQYVQAAALSQWGTSGASTVTVSEQRYVPRQHPGSVVWEPTTCTSSAPPTGAVQSIVITVRGPSTGLTRSIEVVKSAI